MQVQLECLKRQQVNGYGVTRKCVDKKNIEMTGRFALQRKPRVAGNHFDGGLRLAQECELRFCHPHHKRVNFVKTVMISRLAISRERTGPQTDNSHVHVSMFLHGREGNAGA